MRSIFYCGAILTFLCIGACQTRTKNSENKNQTAEKVEPEFDRVEAETAIINATLSHLIPESAIEKTRIRISEYRPRLEHPKTMLLYFNEHFLVADSTVIHRFIEVGASDLLLQIHHMKAPRRSARIWEIKNVGDIVVPNTIPVSSAEYARLIGGVHYSLIVFNENKTRAAFIFDFTRFHEKGTAVFCAVEVEKKKGKWSVTSKTCINKGNSMLRE